MQIIRLADSTELNNAWIVGIIAGCALVAIWLVAALSSFAIRQVAQFLRVSTLQSLTEGYGRRVRLAAVIASFAIAIAGAAVLAYTLSRHEDLQPTLDAITAQITMDAVLEIARDVGVVCLFLLAFWVLKVACRRAIARVRNRLSPRARGERQQTFLERFFVHLPSVVNLSLAYALLGLAAEAF